MNYYINYSRTITFIIRGLLLINLNEKNDIFSQKLSQNQIYFKDISKIYGISQTRCKINQH